MQCRAVRPRSRHEGGQSVIVQSRWERAQCLGVGPSRHLLVSKEPPLKRPPVASFCLKCHQHGQSLLERLLCSRLPMFPRSAAVQ
ncbi:unnamed protein product [Lampetra fluviatilis]